MSHSYHRAFSILLTLGLLQYSHLNAGESTEKTSATQSIQLPGITIDAQSRTVDVDAEICIEEGGLELVACTKGTKEHESVIFVEADPAHIHAALLLVGAKHGNPAMRKPINEDKSQWMHYPPSGDFIEVSLVLEDKEGKAVERPLSAFIRPSEAAYSTPGLRHRTHELDTGESQKEFPSTFVFAGSHLMKSKDEPPRYLATTSGNIISISTFGDETLALPGFHSRSDGELIWEIDPTHLPDLGSKVLLRLRLRTQ